MIGYVLLQNRICQSSNKDPRDFCFSLCYEPYRGNPGGHKKMLSLQDPARGRGNPNHFVSFAFIKSLINPASLSTRATSRVTHLLGWFRFSIGQVRDTEPQ